MNTPVISIIVPVYNCQQFLPDCIESLVQQTLENYEVIFVNDASTDNSLDILMAYQKKFPDIIRVIDLKENMRQGGARNKGILESKAKYVGFVDADDFVHPEMYLKLVETAEQNDLDVVYCHHSMINAEAHLSGTLREAEIENAHTEQSLIIMSLTEDNKKELILSSEYGQVWSGCYKRSFILDNELLFPEHLAYEDNYWVYLLYFHINRMAVLSEKLYFYRQQIASTMHKRNAVHHFDKIKISEMLLTSIKEKDILNYHHDILEYVYIYVFTFNTYALLVHYFDHPDITQLSRIQNLLKTEFPNWKRNKYYKNLFTLKHKILMYGMMTLNPKIMIKIMKWIHNSA